MSEQAQRPVINIKVAGKPSRCLIDTGSCCSIIKSSFLEELSDVYEYKIKNSSMVIKSVSNHSIDVLGRVTLPLHFSNESLHHELLIIEAESFPGEILIGVDVLGRLGEASFDFERCQARIGNSRYNFLKCEAGQSENYRKCAKVSTDEVIYGDEECVEGIGLGESMGDMPSLIHLGDEQKVQVENIWEKHRGGISQHATDIGKCDLVEHTIDTGNHEPVFTRQWPIPYHMKEIMKTEIDKMLQMGVIEPCASCLLYTSPSPRDKRQSRMPSSA